MRENLPNSAGGFDTAVLAHNRTGEAILAMASSVSEVAVKERLFLLSTGSPSLNPPLNAKKIPKRSKKPPRTNNRKRVIHDDVFSFHGKTYKVNAKKSGLYVEILKSMIGQFEIAVQKWKRVFVLRFDLHMAYGREDSKIITDFRKRLFQKLKREYGFKQIGFCWAREQERAKTQHYHWALFLDGDLIKRSEKINKIIKQAWERKYSVPFIQQEMPDGNFHMPVTGRPYYFSDSEEVAQEAIYRISYLAKTRGKGYRDKQAKDFQCSRMKAE